MTDHHDPIEEQLRRYADAAEASLPSTPPAVATNRRRTTRPFFAAAAVVALLAGTFGVYTLASDRGDPEPLRSDGTVAAPEVCPGHGAPVGAQPWDMRHALPFVATSDELTSSAGDSGPSFTRTFRTGDGGRFQVTVSTAGDADSSSGLFQQHTSVRPVTVLMCDPSSTADGPRIEMHGLSTRYERSATFSVPLGNGWTLVVTTDTPELVTATMLEQVAAGTYWPRWDTTTGGGPATSIVATTEVTTDASGGSCEDAPAVSEIQGMRVTHLPEGFTPMSDPARSEGGPLDTETSGAWVQDFVDPEGRSIRVMNFWSDDPPGYALAVHDGAPTEAVVIERCPGVVAPVDATLSETSGRIVLTGQDWGHGGFVVHGGPGVTHEQVLEVASGLR